MIYLVLIVKCFFKNNKIKQTFSKRKIMSTFQQLFSIATSLEDENINKPEKLPEIIAAFKKCYDLNPSNKEAKQQYLYYFKLNFERQHGRNTNQEELKLLGNIQVQEDRYEEAVIIYNASIDIDPMIESAAPIYSNRSLCFMHLGRFQEAYDDGDMAAMIKPGFARGHLRRANAAMKLERWKAASESYEKYFELDPEGAKGDAEVMKNKNLAKKI